MGAIYRIDWIGLECNQSKIIRLTTVEVKNVFLLNLLSVRFMTKTKYEIQRIEKNLSSLRGNYTITNILEQGKERFYSVLHIIHVYLVFSFHVSLRVSRNFSMTTKHQDDESPTCK